MDDCRLAVAGLVTPYQLKNEEILFDPANNRTGLLNRVENIIYSVWDGTRTIRYQKPVTLTRKFADGSEYDSVLEFYHVFSVDEIDPAGAYTVTLYGIDKNGERVAGTKENFVVNHAPAVSVEGWISVDGINKFGNVSLNISPETFKSAGFEEGDIIAVMIGDKRIDMPFVMDYTDVKRGAPLLVSDKGRLAMWVSMGSFAETYGIARRVQETAEAAWLFSDGTSEPRPVILSMKQKAGYLEDYKLRREMASAKPKRERIPGQTDEEFANFREIMTTGMKRDTLFRSSSPIDDRVGRRETADQCIKAHGIEHIINLYNTKEEAEAIEGYQDTYVSSVDTTYIHMGLDYTSARFLQSMRDVMKYIARNTGRYVVHCVLGEHRTGAVCMILEALMGASYDEIAEDYMLTFRNLYGIEPGTRQYALLLDDNVNAVLRNLFGVEDLKNADLKRLAADFIRSAGISNETLALVKAHLGK